MEHTLSFPSRREALATLCTATLAGFSGCNFPGSGDSVTDPVTKETTDGLGTGTVVYTDTPEETTETADSEAVVVDARGEGSFQRALDTVARTPGATLRFEPGTYTVSPQPRRRGGGGTRYHAHVEGLEKVTVEGNGARLLFPDPTLAGLEVSDSAGLTVQNLTLDYESVPFTQGTVMQVRRDDRVVEVILEDGYASLNDEMFQLAPIVTASVHTAEGEFVSDVRKEGSPHKHFSEIEQVGDRRFALSLTKGSNFRGISTGRKFAIVARDHYPLLKFFRVDNPELVAVDARASKGAVFSFQVCDNPTMRRCNIAPPPDSGRLLGANADGARFINCLSDPSISDCTFEYLSDDGIVVQHTLAPVKATIDERTLRVGNVHPFLVGLEDTLGVMAPGGERKGNLPPITDLEFRHSSGGKRGKPETVSFAEPVSDRVEVGDLLGNLATASRGFIVADNTVRSVRGRNVRIAAGHGTVEGNTLGGCNLASLVLESEGTTATFAAKGWVSKVEVRNNRIKNPGRADFAGEAPAGIRVRHHAPPGTGRGRPNRDLIVADNEVVDGAYVGLLLEDAASLDVSGNEVKNPNALEYRGFTEAAVRLHNVEEADLTSNTVKGSEEDLELFGIRRLSEAVSASKNEFRVDGEERATDILELVPVTLTFDPVVKAGNRNLAFLCLELSLLSSDGSVVANVDVGGEEHRIAFGRGVWNPVANDGRTWRWFGNASRTTTLFFSSSQLATARRLRVRGKPIEAGIEMTVQVAGAKTDTVSLGPNEPQTYVVDLD
jgi:hypothetical protein